MAFSEFRPENEFAVVSIKQRCDDAVVVAVWGVLCYLLLLE